ncbi:hypothetical protein MLD38_005797 [Melastoma candidum]|uniref:Uncharacterized protein n=1 Tax=Melastoma candidum TaxID=119954 RepID=A0ACB9RKV6_9MYRT|nr:hypothetical protein MLD38_005797 [Melastoma candidum]
MFPDQPSVKSSLKHLNKASHSLLGRTLSKATELRSLVDISTSTRGLWVQKPEYRIRGSLSCSTSLG